MKKLMITTTCLMLLSGYALADGRELATKNVSELTADTAAAATGDKYLRYDASADEIKTVDATEVFTLFGAAPVALTSTTETLTAADYGDKILLVSASGNNQAITLPDGGTASGACFHLYFGDNAPAGDYAATVAVPSGDNSVFYGNVLMGNQTDLITYSSAATAGTDTLTFTSANTDAGDFVNICSLNASSFSVEGSVRYASSGEDTIIFSSAVASVD